METIKPAAWLTMDHMDRSQIASTEYPLMPLGENYAGWHVIPLYQCDLPAILAEREALMGMVGKLTNVLEDVQAPYTKGRSLLVQEARQLLASIKRD